MIVELNTCPYCTGTLTKSSKQGFKRCGNCQIRFRVSAGAFIRRHGRAILSVVLLMPLIWSAITVTVLAAHHALPVPRLVFTAPSLKITPPTVALIIPSTETATVTAKHMLVAAR